MDSMRAIVFDEFNGPLRVAEVPIPDAPAGGVLIKVLRTGLCRSDWHGWVGHDPTIRLPHVPGHEFAGVIEAVGDGVNGFAVGDRVTTPFVAGCGTCVQCHQGNQQVCADQSQPGFTHWGSFAEYVAVDQANLNVVKLPSGVGFEVAASLGCRFSTAFRGVVDQGRLRPGDWLVVFGCGGVGLSAVMIGRAMGAQVIAVDISDEALALAAQLGATHILNERDPVAKIRELTHGGAQVSVDALGHRDLCAQSVACLAPRGRHIQIGLLAGEHANPAMPMELVVARELEILGSHGIQAHRYPAMLGMIKQNALNPAELVTRTVSLEQAVVALRDMDRDPPRGVTMIDPWC